MATVSGTSDKTPPRPKIAIFSGPTATVQNSEPLVTSNKARQKYGLELRANPDGSPARFDADVQGVQRVNDEVKLVPVNIKDDRGRLITTAIPKVTIVKTARYLSESPDVDPYTEVEIFARIEKNLKDFPLAGFVAEGVSPYGNLMESLAAALKRAALAGMPVVRVGRGNAEGFTMPPSSTELTIAGSNLTATKARLLLMACLLKFGSLPPVADPNHPTDAELNAIKGRLTQYQHVFDTH